MKRQTREQRAAAAGARWLDKNRPGWAENINLQTLDLEHECYCVLGQCFGEYYDALRELQPKDEDRDQPWARAHGFNAQLDDHGRDRNGSYERLALAWAPLVAVRQVGCERGSISH